MGPTETSEKLLVFLALPHGTLRTGRTYGSENQYR